MSIKRLIDSKFLILALILLAFFLRIYKIGVIPPGLTPDEASLGYNAYSILKTGKDEYGTFLPLIFKSFGDFKPGLYVYLTVPSVLIFGLNEFSVRLPSVLAGVLSVFLIYLLVKNLFQNKKLAIIALFAAGINPWLIYFSRGAWEVNLALTLTLLGIYFFLKSFEKQKLFVVSAFFFGLTLIAYQGAKLSTGIVIFILLLLYHRQILKFKIKNLVFGFLMGFIVTLPILMSFFTGEAGRLNVFSVFSYPRPEKYLQDFLNEGGEKKGSLNYYFFHSESLNFARGILGRYFNHFSARFLFFEGDWANPRHTVPNSGVLVLGDFVFLALGIVALIRKKLSRGTVFVWLWLALASLPAVLSRDQVHAVRSFNMAIPLVIVISLGIFEVLENFKKPFIILIFISYALTYIYFLDSLFVHQAKHSSQLWQYGYKQMVEKVTSVQTNYKSIKVQQSFSQPYIYFLFYQKYDPAKYQKQAKLTESEYKGDVGYITNLDNICFCPIDWSVNRGDHASLIVADPVRIPAADSSDPHLFKVLDEIKYLDTKETAFRLIEVK